MPPPSSILGEKVTKASTKGCRNSASKGTCMMQNMKVIVFCPFVVLHPYKHQKSNSRKSVRWPAVPLPCLSSLCLKLDWKQCGGPKGVHDLCFHTYGEFSPSSPPPSPPLSFHPQIQVLRPKSQFRGPNLSLEVQIPAKRPRSQPGD